MKDKLSTKVRQLLERTVETTGLDDDSLNDVDTVAKGADVCFGTENTRAQFGQRIHGMMATRDDDVKIANVFQVGEEIA